MVEEEETEDRISRALTAVREEEQLKVVVKNDALPFSTCEPSFRGIAVDLWNDFARARDIRYELISGGDQSYDAILEGVRDGVYDVAIGDFSVIHRRFSWGLYSRPYFISTIHVFRKARDTSGIKIAMESRMVTTLLLAIGVMLVLFSILRAVVTRTGILNSAYATFLRLFMSATGEIVKVDRMRKRKERHRGGKIGAFMKVLNMIWIFCVFVVVQLLVAQLISSFVRVVESIGSEELRKVSRLHVTRGSSFVDYALRHGYSPVEVDDLYETARNLKDNEYWMGDLVATEEFARTYRGKEPPEFHKSENPVILDEYSIVFSSRLADMKFLFDLNLVKLRSSNFISDSCRKYHVRAIYSCTM